MDNFRVCKWKKMPYVQRADQTRPSGFPLAGAMDPVVALGAKVDVQEIKDKLEAKRRSLTVSPYKSTCSTNLNKGKESACGLVCILQSIGVANHLDVGGCWCRVGGGVGGVFP
jgi:hypothetical protein